jgi:pyrroline-5-carboxylate reductase
MISSASPTVAFIGGGNMATSLIGGLLARGFAAGQIRVAEPDAMRAEALRQQFGVQVAASARDVVADADALLLAVKPQQMTAALSGLQPARGCLVLSIAAGVRVDTLRSALGDQVEIVRSMPNTPALVGAGISGLYAPPGTSETTRELAERLLQATGQTCWVEQEADLDAVTAVSGSGPAYFFLLTEALREAGVSLGLRPEVAARLAAQTFVGAARMVEQGTTDVAVLRAQVTSKGGTTEAALRHLEQAGLRPMFTEALRAAAHRSRELGDELAASAHQSRT